MIKAKFTLIELIAVIVILGIISVFATARYVNMHKEAADAVAEATFSSAQVACNQNFISGALGKIGHSAITNANQIPPLMVDSGVLYAENNSTLHCNLNDTTYVINLVSPETTDRIAILELIIP